MLTGHPPSLIIGQLCPNEQLPTLFSERVIIPTRAIKYKKAPLNTVILATAWDCEIHPCIPSLRDYAVRRMSKFVPDKFVEPCGLSSRPAPSNTKKPR
ncbi:MAG: hypothetical protein ACI88A_004585 [Paraglaciecola sp.]|jgi:hypothetical protein